MVYLQHLRCRKIVGGTGKGKALVTKQPINFLAMMETRDARIIDQTHELFGKSIKDIVLVFPNAIGSSVGAYTLYSLKVNGVAPIGIICSNKADIITASGCAISNIPVVDMLDKPALSIINSGMDIRVNADNAIVEII
jgi:predicted aconitase with swiveling domain